MVEDNRRRRFAYLEKFQDMQNIFHTRDEGNPIPERRDRIIVENEKTGVCHLSDDGLKTFCGLGVQDLNVVDLPSSLEMEKEYMYCTCRYNQWQEFYQDITALKKKYIPMLEYALESTIFIRAGEMIYKYIWETKHHLEKLSKKREKFHPLIQENYARLHLLFEEEKGGIG